MKQVKTLSIHESVQLPLQLRNVRKRDVRSQFGALVYRVRNGKLQILLITSRQTGRWIVPKGWPMPGTTPSKAAAVEAWEEAGVTGKVSEQCLGVYTYRKSRNSLRDLPCIVMLYPLKARKLSLKYPEVKERRRKWFSRKKAAKRVNEPELARLIETFDPELYR